MSFAEIEPLPPIRPKGEIVARAIAGVIVRRELGNRGGIRGLALETAIKQGVDDMWLHLVDEASAVLIALRQDDE